MSAGAWDALFQRGEPYHGPAPSPFFASFLPPAARVLDLGCGAGKSLRALREASPSWRLLGLDASPAALARAARVAPVARADAGALPLRAASLDAVRIHFLLGHLRDPASAAREVERALAPGGWLEVREFAAGDLRDGTGRAAGPRTFERGGVATRYVAPGELAALFPRCAGGEERVHERAVRFAPRPRRVAELRARRAERA